MSSLDTDDIVHTAAGTLRGLRLEGGIRSYRGIPYAAAPVGPLRWKPPAPLQPWSGVRDAREFGADAFQSTGIRETRAPGMSEDCLFLNVWAPEERPAGGLPVIVWSGGGAFATGGGSFATEDLTRLAARGAVVVSFNYRLGIFGFLAHPALTAESPFGSSGNYGLMDHAAALRWVRTHIAAFGGDPTRITYMGESSGAAAALLLLTTAADAAPFDRAVLLSPGSVNPLLPLAAAERSGARLKGTAEELRAIPAEDLLARTPQLAAPPSNLTVARPLRPIVDGWLITDDRAYATGAFESVPVIIGTNEDEGRFFVRRMKVSSLGDYAEYLAATFGSSADEAAARYPAGSHAEVAAAVAAAYGDVSVNHPTDRLARAFARRSDTYRYVYSYRHGDTEQPPTHADEAGTFLDDRPHLVPDDIEMAALIGRYLINFAAHGDPNDPDDAADLPEWPPFDEQHERYQRLDLPIASESHWRSGHLTFVADALTTSPA